MVVDQGDFLIVEGKDTQQRIARPFEGIGVGDPHVGQDVAFQCQEAVRLDPLFVIEERVADIAARNTAVLTVFVDNRALEAVDRSAGCHDGIDDGLQRLVGTQRAVVGDPRIVLDFLQGKDIRAAHVVDDLGGKLRDLVRVAIRRVRRHVEHVVGRDRQVVRRPRNRGDLGGIGAGRFDCERFGHIDLVVSEPVSDDAGYIAEIVTDIQVRPREPVRQQIAIVLDLDPLGVEIAIPVCVGIQVQRAAIVEARCGSGAVICDDPGFVEPVGGRDRDRVVHGHQHAFQAFVEVDAVVFRIIVARIGLQVYRQLVVRDDLFGRDRTAVGAQYDRRDRVARGQDLLGVGADLGDRQVARSGAARDELGHIAGDFDLVADRECRCRAGVDKDAVRCGVVAVPVGILQIVAVRVDRGHDAGRRHRAPDIFGNVAFALDVHDRDDRVDRAEIVNGGCPGYLVGHRNLRIAGGAFVFGDEGDDLGRMQRRGAVGRVVDMERRNVVHVERIRRVRDVVDHDAAVALQPDKGIEAAANLAYGDGFRFGAFGIRTILAIVAIVVIETLGRDLGDDPFELIGRVKDQVAIRVEDRERPRRESVKHVDIAVSIRVAVDGGHLQTLQPGDVDARVYQARRGQIFHARLVKAAAVAFVCGGDIGLAVHLERGDRVRHPEPGEVVEIPDIDFAVIVGVQLAVAAEIDDPQREDVDDRVGGQIDLGDGVVFLKRDKGRGPVGADGDVFWLDILAKADTLLDPDTRVAGQIFEPVELGEVQDLGGRRGRVGDIDHGDGAQRVVVIVAVIVLFAFAGDQQLCAVFAEGQLIGQVADVDCRQQRACLGIEQGHDTGLRQHDRLTERGLRDRRARDGDGDDAVLDRHRLNPVVAVQTGQVDERDRIGRRACGLGDVEDVDPALFAVGDIELAIFVRDRFRRAFATFALEYGDGFKHDIACGLRCRFFGSVQNGVTGEVQVLDACVAVATGVRLVIGVCRIGMVVVQIFGQRVLFGPVGRKCRVAGHGAVVIAVAVQVVQIDTVRLGAGGEGIAVAAACQEVERDNADGCGRVPDNLAVLDEFHDQVAVFVKDRSRLDTCASRQIRIERELYARHLRERSGNARQSADAMFQNVHQFLLGQGQQRQRVVEGQGGLDVVLADAARRFDDVAVAVDQFAIRQACRRGAARQNHRFADRGADPAAVLDRHDDIRIDVPGCCEVGVSGQVAEVGFLRPHAVGIGRIAGA